MDIKALMDMNYGMYILTTMSGNKPTGCLVNSIMQVTAQPPIVAACINKNNWTNVCIKTVKSFAVSILSEQIKPIIIGKFGFYSGKNTNKFEGIEYEITSNNMPILKADICGWFSCKLVEIKELETHTLFFGEVIDAKQIGAKPMTYDYYHRVIKGKTQSNAPTYQKDNL